MFVDQVSIFVKAGKGGDGLVAFRREKHVPFGGPAGGDGGHGGDVVFEVDEGLNTLMDFRYNRHFTADHGVNGLGKNQHGRNAETLVVPVPPGTIITDEDTEQVIADLTEEGEQAIIAKGGRGGRGNSRFANSRNPAPKIAENGEPGEERNIRVELKLLADVGLVGLPNVGKSTLLSVTTAAKPKIDSYHFTTISPNLGVIETDDYRSFVMADLPGLIEGAHEGVGLGHQFLKHVERTRVIVHVLDMAGLEGRDPFKDYENINQELKKYDKHLTNKPQIIAANKMDMPHAEENLKKFREKIADQVEVFPISALTREGLREIVFAIAKLLDETPKQDPLIDTSQRAIYTKEQAESFQVSRDADGIFVLSGEQVERLFQMTNFEHEESAQKFARQLRRMGIDDALREKGATDGDIVRLLDFEFEFVES